MDDAEAMRLRQALAYLERDGRRHVGSELSLPAQDRPQVLACHMLHDEVTVPAVLSKVIEAADALVDDPAGQLELVPEPLDRPGIGRSALAQDLEGDLLVDLVVKG